MKNKNNNDITIKSIWNFIRSKKGKRYSFVIFYVFFFIFLFIFLGTNYQSSSETKKDVFPFSINNIENKSYSFSFIINFNSNLSEYIGNKKSNQIILNDDRGTYNFEYRNGLLVRVDDNSINIPYYKLLDIYEVKRIIKNSKLISETKLNETNDYIYNYEIKNEFLNEILSENNSNLDEINEIIVHTNSLKEVKKISFNLLNYEKNKQDNVNNYLVEITYGDVDE